MVWLLFLHNISDIPSWSGSYHDWGPPWLLGVLTNLNAEWKSSGYCPCETSLLGLFMISAPKVGVQCARVTEALGSVVHMPKFLLQELLTADSERSEEEDDDHAFFCQRNNKWSRTSSSVFCARRTPASWVFHVRFYLQCLCPELMRLVIGEGTWNMSFFSPCLTNKKNSKARRKSWFYRLETFPLSSSVDI